MWAAHVKSESPRLPKQRLQCETCKAFHKSSYPWLFKKLLGNVWSFEAKIEIVSSITVFCLSKAIHLDTWDWPGDVPMSALAFSGVFELFHKNKVQLLKFFKWLVPELSF